MNWQWDNRQERIIKEVADEEQVLTSQGKQVLEFFVKQMIGKMRELVPVVVPNLGRFFLSPWKTEKMLRNLFKAEKNGTITKEELRERVAIYWPLHEKARKHNPRTGAGYRAWLKRENELYGQNGNGVELQPPNENREKERPEGTEGLPKGETNL